MKRTSTLLLATAFATTAFAQIPGYGEYEIYFDIVGNGFGHNTIIYFNDAPVWDPNAVITAGWEDCCEANMILGNTNQPHIFTSIVAGNTLPPGLNRMSINALPLLTGPYDVPFGLYVGTAGSYTISATRIWTFAPAVGIIFEDTQTQTMQDLRVDSSYAFTSALTDNEARFIVHFDVAVGVDASNIKANRIVAGQEQLLVTAANVGGKLQIFDMSGRCVLDQRSNTEGQATFHMGAMPTGVYVARYSDSNGTLVRKFAR